MRLLCMCEVVPTSVLPTSWRSEKMSSRHKAHCCIVQNLTSHAVTVCFLDLQCVLCQCSKNIPSQVKGPTGCCCKQSADLFLPCSTDSLPGFGKLRKKEDRWNEPEALKVCVRRCRLQFPIYCDASRLRQIRSDRRMFT